MKSIGVDFNGVIHGYSKGWHDGTIYDDPMPGAFKALSTLLDSFTVFVFTARDLEPVAQWLTEQGQFEVYVDRPYPSGAWIRFWNERGKLLVTNRKLPAVAYVDDRAIRFTDWAQALADVKALS